MLTKDLLRVSRRGGGFRPRFVDDDRRELAARLIGLYQGHVGEPRGTLEEALEAVERDADDFKLVRGLAALLDREATYETRAPVPPARARRAAFEAAEAVGVVTEDERERALARAADDLGVDAAAVETSLYADRESRRVLDDFGSRWDPAELIEQYNLSLAQTALFDATEVRIRTADPKGAISAIKRLGLMYEIRRSEDGGSRVAGGSEDGTGDRPGTESDREIVVTGPDALFRRTRRYGTAFARLLRTVAASAAWTLAATIDDRGTEREMRLTEADVSVPGVEPLSEPTFDSGVEADFAARFAALDLDWTVIREPEPLAAGTRVMIPDFAFEYAHEDFRVYFEVMGYWTPEYVEKKLGQLADLEEVDMLVAVDESLGVGEEVAARDHRVITYSGTVRVKDVVDVLREYEDDLVAEAAADLPAEFAPDAEVVALADLAAEYGTSVDAIEDKAFPEHERIGRTLVRPAVLDDLAGDLEPGLSLSEAEDVLAERGMTESSAVLSRLGYEVVWEGLGGGTLQRK